MCNYCEKGKYIEERAGDNIFIEIYGKHLRVIGRVLNIPLGRDVIINYCPMCRKEAKIMIKEFCDICKVEIDRHEVLNPINTPKENFKICNQCLDDLLQYIQNKENNFKLENKRYEMGFNKKWEEIC